MTLNNQQRLIGHKTKPNQSCTFSETVRSASKFDFELEVIVSIPSKKKQTFQTFVQKLLYANDVGLVFTEEAFQSVMDIFPRACPTFVLTISLKETLHLQTYSMSHQKSSFRVKKNWMGLILSFHLTALLRWIPWFWKKKGSKKSNRLSESPKFVYSLSKVLLLIKVSLISMKREFYLSFCTLQRPTLHITVTLKSEKDFNKLVGPSTSNGSL